MADKDEQIVEDEVTDEDLANLKAEDDSKKGVEAEKPDEPSKEEPKPDEEEESESEEETPDDKPTFAKAFPNIKGDSPDEYIPNLEEAYKNSTSEAIRLKQENDKLLQDKPEEVDVSTNPAVQYAESMMQNEVNQAFEKFSGDYPQVRDMDTFEKFRNAVGGVSDAIRQAEGRTPTFEEAYYKTASVLGWEKEDSDKVGAAAKAAASSTKTNSATKSTPKSKVTDKQIAVGRQMFPGKSDSEIRKELETVQT